MVVAKVAGWRFEEFFAVILCIPRFRGPGEDPLLSEGGPYLILRLKFEKGGNAFIDFCSF